MRTRSAPRFGRVWRLVAVLLGAVATLPVVAGPAAEIVSVQGKGEYRPTAAADWVAAKVKQSLDAGTYVRTVQVESKMSLLLSDQTQFTLQGISFAQIKAPEAAAPRKSIIDFGKGVGRFQTKTPAKEFSVTTPTGTAAIRGTEWLVEVGDDGRSAFTV